MSRLGGACFTTLLKLNKILTLSLSLSGSMEALVFRAWWWCLYGTGTFFFPTGDASNLLFVESPAGVGWSYSNTTSDYNAWDISTGHYIPQSAVALLDHNANSSAFKFNIKGVAPPNQRRNSR
ncbi:hypothetical protein BVRB_1g010790 [Beta vulgaris subsp. vulgaris]|nr:hypothetical protein BVRB_1g010790 [Beta vulgaris subsp. vulgaris]